MPRPYGQLATSTENWQLPFGKRLPTHPTVTSTACQALCM